MEEQGRMRERVGCLPEGSRIVSGLDVLLAFHIPIPIPASCQLFMCFLRSSPSPVIIERKCRDSSKLYNPCSGIAEHMDIASEVGAVLLEYTPITRRVLGGNSGIFVTGVLLLSTRAWVPLGKKGSKRLQH